MNVDLNTYVYSHDKILIHKRGRWLYGRVEITSLKGTFDVVIYHEPWFIVYYVIHQNEYYVTVD